MFFRWMIVIREIYRYVMGDFSTDNFILLLRWKTFSYRETGSYVCFVWKIWSYVDVVVVFASSFVFLISLGWRKVEFEWGFVDGVGGGNVLVVVLSKMVFYKLKSGSSSFFFTIYKIHRNNLQDSPPRKRKKKNVCIAIEKLFVYEVWIVRESFSNVTMRGRIVFRGTVDIEREHISRNDGNWEM